MVSLPSSIWSGLTELYNWCSDRVTNDSIQDLIIAQPPDGNNVGYSSSKTKKGASKSIHTSPMRDSSPSSRMLGSNVMLTSVGTRIIQQTEQPSPRSFVLSKHNIPKPTTIEEQSSTATKSMSFSSCSFDSISSCFNPCIHDGDVDEGQNATVHPLLNDRRVEKLLKGKKFKATEKETQKKMKKIRSKSLDCRSRLSRIENDCDYDDDDNEDAVKAKMKRKMHHRSLKSLPPYIEHSEIMMLTSLADDDISELTYT